MQAADSVFVQGFVDASETDVDCVVWEEALARRRSIFSYAYDHPAASNAWKIVRKAKEKIFDE